MLITGKAYYAKVFQPEQPKNPKWSARWKVSVVVEDKVAESLKKAGLTIRPANDYIPGNHVEVIRYTTKGDGSEAENPVVVNSKKQPITDLIGNGSDVNVSCYFNADSDMKHPRLDALQVVNLVPVAGFEPRGVDAFEEVEGGYEGTSAPVANEEDVPFDQDDFFSDEPQLDDSRLV